MALRLLPALAIVAAVFPSAATGGKADLGELVVRGKDRESTAILAVVHTPGTLSLRVQSKPTQTVYVEISGACMKAGRRDGIGEQFVRGSGFVKRIKTSIGRPDRCKVFAFVRYPQAPGRGVVTASLYER
ncbi:MAG: hypothetical protein KDB58_07200 [Solirubrobacterales bacterium]|nr:hypothetical protein [Solirubrobacterales bacterium]MCB8970292.1 hypothetical protein [Thermoleophilales bacterium]MCB9617777.1 hypothetical protein [Sandaracinus sp.]